MHPIQHFNTITRHRNLVCHYCMKLGLVYQGLTHDLSKYSPTEFIPGARYFQGYRSPNDAERQATGISLAWLHHKGRNRHHLEYWIDYRVHPDGSVRFEGNPMPLRYVAEMFCDRIAASRVYQGENYTDDKPYEYFMNARDDIDGLMHPDTARELETMLTVLKEKGEDAAFAYVRRRLRRDRRRRGAGLLLHHRGELT